MDVFETRTNVPRQKSLHRERRPLSGAQKAVYGFLIVWGMALFLGGVGNMYKEYDENECFGFIDCLDFLSIVLVFIGLFFIVVGSYYLEKDRRLRKELEKENQ